MCDAQSSACGGSPPLSVCSRSGASDNSAITEAFVSDGTFTSGDSAITDAFGSDDSATTDAFGSDEATDYSDDDTLPRVLRLPRGPAGPAHITPPRPARIPP